MRRENGKWVTCGKCNKIIYGTTNAALMAYRKLVRHLKKWNYVMTPCDSCAWNAEVLGGQITLLFHINNVLLTHAMGDIVTEHIKLLDKAHSINDLLTVTRGKVV